MHLFLITANVVVFGGVLTSANCPVGTFEIWSQWDRCGASCGGGIQKRWQSLCCPPDAHGQWSDCRATYNLTEKFNFDYKPCNQICAHGRFIAGRCSCDPGYDDTCCITRQSIVSTQIVFGDLTTRPSTKTVTVKARPSTSIITVETTPNTSTTTVTTSSSTSTTTVTTSSSTSTTTITTKTTPLRITTDNTSSILRLATTTVNSSSQHAQNSSSAAYADIKFGDNCTNTTCSTLMVCKKLSRGGHHCECKKLGNTNISVYYLCTNSLPAQMLPSSTFLQCGVNKLKIASPCVFDVLLIIFGSVTVGSATLLVIFILALKKRKIIPEKADVTEMGETVSVKN